MEGRWVEELIGKLQRKEETIESLREELIEQDHFIEELLDQVEVLEEDNGRLNDQLEEALLSKRQLQREFEELQRKL